MLKKYGTKLYLNLSRIFFLNKTRDYEIFIWYGYFFQKNRNIYNDETTNMNPLNKPFKHDFSTFTQYCTIIYMYY